MTSPITDDSVTVYGLDPALRHGSLLRATWNFAGKIPELAEVNEIYKWSQSSSVSCGVKDDPAQIQRLSMAILRSLKDHPAGYFSIDWDFNVGISVARKTQLVRMSYFMGYLTRCLQGRGNIVVMFAPLRVRRAFGLKNTAGKTDVFLSFEKETDLGKYNIWRGGRPLNNNQSDEDWYDALILSYVMAKAMLQEARNATITAKSSDMVG